MTMAAYSEATAEFNTVAESATAYVRKQARIEVLSPFVEIENWCSVHQTEFDYCPCY